MPPMRVSSLSLLVLVLLPLSGCCSLSRFFCGPDRTPWVSVRYETPQLAVKTLLEALRRDDWEIVCLSLSQAYQQRLGLDQMTARVVGPRIREQNPGLHVAGYAEVPEPTLLDPDHASVTIDVQGTPIEIHLVRQRSREVRFRRPDGSIADQGALLESFVGHARIEPVDRDQDLSRLVLEPLQFYHDGLEVVPVEALEHMALTSRWKVDDLRVLEHP